MFSLNKCLVHACMHQAISTIDENGNITEKKGYCLDHIPNPGKTQDDIKNYIHNHDFIVGLNAEGMTFSNEDLSNKTFIGCNFMHTTFTNVHSKSLKTRMSFFDFAVFIDCNLINSDIQYTCFAGCTFSNTLFTGSDLLLNNYNGISALQSSFDDSDLYKSRFIMANLTNTSFRNCNIKETHFIKVKQENVSFKMSNTKEAIFSENESELSNNFGYTGGITVNEVKQDWKYIIL